MPESLVHSLSAGLTLSGTYLQDLRKAKSTVKNDPLSEAYEKEELALWRLLFSFQPLREKVVALVPVGPDIPVVSSTMDVDAFITAAKTFRLHDEWRTAMTQAANLGMAYPVLDNKTDSFVKQVKRAFDATISARNAFISANLFLVVKTLNGRIGNPDFVRDSIQDGNLGLIRAVDRYLPGSGGFISYATWWIRAFTQHTRMNGAIDYPRRLREQVSTIYKMMPGFLCQHGRHPTATELSAVTSMSEGEAAHALEMYRVINHESFVDAGAGMDTTDQYGTEDLNPFYDTNNNMLVIDWMEHQETLHTLSAGLDRLDNREATILRLHYGLDGQAPITLSEISTRIGLCRERVRQIEARAHQKLRSAVLS